MSYVVHIHYSSKALQVVHKIDPPHENKKMEGRVRERRKKISGEVGNLKKKIDSTNKMSKRPN